jgi:hypothetical protein
MVASDDISWCKQHLDLGSTNILYLENYKPEEQLWIMSLCHNFIISNSSFSWWAAYLSRYENKKVFAPSIWYGPEGPKTWNEIYCSDWNIVNSYFENGLIHLKK